MAAATGLRAAIARTWKGFGAVGAAVGFADQYKEGYEGKGFGWKDFGPQAFPKALGWVHHSHNMEAQMRGRWEEARAYHDAIASTPPFRTNIKFAPNLSSLDK